jgi:DNA polymerase V
MRPVSFVRTEEGLNKSVPSIEDSVASYKNPLSLDALFVQHPAATYFIEVEGHSDQHEISENKFLGVLRGDVLTVDRALTPTLGRLVLAVCDGSFALCRYTEHEGRQFLVCGNESATAREIDSNGEVCIWGVVSAICRKV